MTKTEVELITDFEKSKMSKLRFSKVHSITRAALNMFLSAKETNFQQQSKWAVSKNGCAHLILMKLH